MNRSLHYFLPAITLAFSLTSAVAHAGIQLSNTRVVLDEGKRSAAVYAKNTGDPVVVQAWIEGVGEKMETPFFITPPLSRFDGDTERSLTITRVGGDIPGDRETYYWVNVLEIPQKATSAENSLSFATRTRIKLFYRPTVIQKAPRGPEQLAWTVSRHANACQLEITNASPFTVNFSRIDVPSQARGFGMGVVALPLATTTVALQGCLSGGTSLTPHVVNDYGAVEAWPAVTLPGASDGRPMTGQR